ncbi:MAG: hypothetical protein Q7U38_14280 [Methylobacter sp.]|nr:hypothetical protein [Methylobacter sp.]MDP2169665.1 hypothetical protein [Rhodocyclaceae bacterium]MDP2429022.1 hypothetical protein [Methylobacter sp.]MDP3056523.1 hypothetical protein [Methylobacter sp.]MDP3362012.1 hypothetical protein [Methylobacter sp.]
MNRYALLLQGGQCALDIDAWDMGHALRTAAEKIAEGWAVYAIRCESGYEAHL